MERARPTVGSREGRGESDVDITIRVVHYRNEDYVSLETVCDMLNAALDEKRAHYFEAWLRRGVARAFRRGRTGAAVEVHRASEPEARRAS